MTGNDQAVQTSDPIVMEKHIQTPFDYKYYMDSFHCTTFQRTNAMKFTFCFRFLQLSQATATRFRLDGSTRLLIRRSAAFSSAVALDRLCLLGTDGEVVDDRASLLRTESAAIVVILEEDREGAGLRDWVALRSNRSCGVTARIRPTTAVQSTTFGSVNRDIVPLIMHFIYLEYS